MLFVYKILRKVSDGTYNVEGTTHETMNDAKHRFHSLMNAYAYGANENFDYVRCSIVDDQSGELMLEIDDRRPVAELTPEEA